jgi:hypothetical protein
MTWQELKAKALANPKGKMVPYEDAKCRAEAVLGPWNGSGPAFDPLQDLVFAAQKLSSIPSYIIGNIKTLGVLLSIRYNSMFPTWFKLLPLFKDGGNLWEGPAFLRYDIDAEDGLVILVGVDGSAVLIDAR